MKKKVTLRPRKEMVIKMRKYRVWARSIDYCYLDVEAESEDEAYDIASQTDGGEFCCDSASGEWEMDHVDKIED